MKITYVTASDETEEKRDGRGFFKVIVDGKIYISVFDDEPEDSNLSRSFSGVYQIPALIKIITSAMARGESIEFETAEE